MRWAGRKGGLYPEEHQLRIDAVTDTVVELYEHIVKVGYGSAMTTSILFFLSAKEAVSLPAHTSWPEYELSAVCERSWL